jgi:Xaa-Pro aminopeptidase
MQKQRIFKLRQLIQSQKLSAIIITNPINRNYLSGFTGTEAILLIGLTKSYFITDFRYTKQAKKQVHGFQIVERKTVETPIELGAELIQKNRWERVGFEAENVAYTTFGKLKKELGKLNLVPTAGLVESLREIKDASELELIEQASNIADAALKKCLPAIKIGKTEKEIANIYEYEAKKLGADKVSFDIIVASGPRAALPHGVASTKKIKKGELIVFDFGVVYQGYNSDCTRTFLIGKPTAKQKEIYDLVLTAQQTTLSIIQTGIKCQELDNHARSIIEKAGYGKYFGHGLGHGVGREVHELPKLNKLNQIKLAPGMVITIEPGIYLPNWGGVRIEDLVVVTKSGYKLLTHFPKELICLPK